MKVLHKKVVQQHTQNGAPICAGVLYISETEPKLMRRIGWEIGDDIHDDYRDAFSNDNGATWSEPESRPAWNKTARDGGHFVHIENAMFYQPQRDRLWHFTNRKFQSTLDGYDANQSPQLSITHGTPLQVSTGEGASTLLTDFGVKQGVMVSFCRPIQDARGRILVPVCWQKEDTSGVLRAQRHFRTRSDMPDVLLDAYEPSLLIGETNEQGEVAWTIGEPVPFDFEHTSRGLCEGAITELRDGRLAMVLRGSNVGRPEMPGYKWLTFSEDGGWSWSTAAPLACDDGTLLESSATGSNLFRSRTDGELYWIGNLCLNGASASGNWPRSPLVIAQIQEEPFAIRRDTITIIDQAAPHESLQVQHLNFKSYPDRETGDVVVYLTRYGERATENMDWLRADLYEYRVALHAE